MAHPKSLFHAEVVNDQALQGEAFVKNDGLRVVISDPLSPDLGTNPEELLGLSLSTCLNATIQALLKGRGLKNKSQVEVHIDLVLRKKKADSFSKYWHWLKLRAYRLKKRIESFKQQKSVVR